MSKFKTIAKSGRGEFKDRGSRFIAFAQSCYHEEDAKKLIEELRKKHHKASHVCSAYKIGLENQIMRVHDDGEPSNTAGPPIMNYINKYELDNVVVAVVRYFGGSLLGKGGLIQAYGTAAEQAIKNGTIVTLSEKISLHIDLPFDDYALLMGELKKLNAEFVTEEFDDNCHIEIRIEKDNLAMLLAKMDDFKIHSIKYDL